jgi:hypothetical protein
MSKRVVKASKKNHPKRGKREEDLMEDEDKKTELKKAIGIKKKAKTNELIELLGSSSEGEGDYEPCFDEEGHARLLDGIKRLDKPGETVGGSKSRKRTLPSDKNIIERETTMTVGLDELLGSIKSTRFGIYVD